jgi:hypothetical protein
MTKLEHMYVQCTRTVAKSLDFFYNDFLIKPSELSVDSDTLQSILMYVTSRLNYP